MFFAVLLLIRACLIQRSLCKFVCNEVCAYVVRCAKRCFAYIFLRAVRLSFVACVIFHAMFYFAYDFFRLLFDVAVCF